MNHSEQDRSFWDGVAGKYDRVVGILAAPYRKTAELIKADLRPGDQVLELAAGTGLFTVEYAADVNTVKATDFSQSMLDIAQSRCAAAKHGRVSFETADVYDLRRFAGQFDVVICANALHIMREPVKALHEMYGALRPAGRLIIPTFCHGQTFTARLVSSVMSAFSGFVSHQKYTDESLARAVGDVGFRVTRKENLGGVLPLVYLAAERVERA